MIITSELISKNKLSDLEYLTKRDNLDQYHLKEFYNYQLWKGKLYINVSIEYEKLHEKLIYKDSKRNYNEVKDFLNFINDYLISIEE